MTRKVEGVVSVSQPVENELNERKLLDYAEYKRDLLQWLLNLGKDPSSAKGYARTTVQQVSYKTDWFYRWLWERNGTYTTTITPDDADDYMQELVYSDEDFSTSHLSSTQKCLQRLFKWQKHQRGATVVWEPEHTFSQDLSQPRDYLTIEEREKIREAALDYGSIPSYTALSPDERDEWKAYLAQRFEKPKSDISEHDWDRANGWNIPSVVWTSLDAGLRPIEVGRATIRWIDTENKVHGCSELMIFKGVSNLGP